MPATTDPSAWRNFPKPPKPRRPVGRPRKRPTPAVFYGCLAELIAQWCCVSRSTADAYKSGRLKPSRMALRLFVLMRDRQVLTKEWAGWLIKPDAIVDPEGNETNRNLLRNYQLMCQYYHSLARRTGDEREIERYYEFLEAGCA